MLSARCLDSSSDFLTTAWDKIVRNVEKSHFNFQFSRDFHIFSALSHVFLFGWLSFVFFFFFCSFFYCSINFTEFRNKKTTTITAKRTMAVYACLLIFCSLLSYSLQNNNMEWTRSAYFREREIRLLKFLFQSLTRFYLLCLRYLWQRQTH